METSEYKGLTMKEITDIPLNEEQTAICIKALDLISETRLRKALQEIIDILPEYFFKVSTSSTSKNHPKFSNGEGGLLRHSLATMIIGNELMQDFILCPDSVRRNMDLVLIALFIHDGCKRGWPEEYDHSVFEHPLIMAEFLENNKELIPSLTDKEIWFLQEAVKTHMGPFVDDWRTGRKNVLEPPCTEIQKFVHLCDYISSRKSINFEI